MDLIVAYGDQPCGDTHSNQGNSDEGTVAGFAAEFMVGLHCESDIGGDAA